MRLEFDAALPHQLDAIEAVCDCLTDTLPLASGLTAAAVGGAAIALTANPAPLDRPTLLTNLQEVQRRHDLAASETLNESTATIDVDGIRGQIAYPNVAVDMETGTGKTYTYLRTALELHRRFGLSKYVIVVPTVAIREGVLKALTITHDHLRSLYPAAAHKGFAYDSSRLEEVFAFAADERVQFMVITLDSVNKESNVLRSRQDRARGQVPLHVIQATRPVLLLDEPQNMNTDLARAALASFDPLLALHYSATHVADHPTVYRLTPWEAYRRNLVKRIEVHSVVSTGADGPRCRLLEASISSNRARAKLSVLKLAANGIPQERTVTVRLGDDLRSKTSNFDYSDDYVVVAIDPDQQRITFANGLEFGVDQRDIDEERDEVTRLQVRTTVERHMRHQRRVRQLGHDAKVLSLFFLEHVDDYVPADGKVRVWFEEAYRELAAADPSFSQVAVEAVHGGYFAQRRISKGQSIAVDSRTDRATAADEDAYRLIMRDKERLLDPETPLAFIFSHSALREGWDSPNVSQVCTLARGTSTVRKRQEIGRGIRLLVDSEGRRITDPQANVLHVVPNESYERFAEGLQRQWREDGGKGTVPVNPRQTVTVRRRREVLESDAFRDLWEAISATTRYTVAIRSDTVVAEAAERLGDARIQPPAIEVTVARVLVGDTDGVSAVATSLPRRTKIASRALSAAELVDLVLEVLANGSPPLRVSRRTVARVLLASGRLGEALDAPRETARVLAGILQHVLPQEMALSIKYTPDGDAIPVSALAEVFQAPDEAVAATPSANNLYTHATIDSQVERIAVATLEGLEDVTAYLKLPRGFSIPTPLGRYSPDWAIALLQPGDAPRLQLVRETKSGELNAINLRPAEEAKIRCGHSHFTAIGVDYGRWDGQGSTLLPADQTKLQSG